MPASLTGDFAHGDIREDTRDFCRVSVPIPVYTPGSNLVNHIVGTLIL